MVKIVSQDDFVNTGNNYIIGECEFENSSIEFKGENNVLFFGENITLKNTRLRFTGDNSLIYIDGNVIPIIINARVGNDSVLYLGRDTYINKGIELYATERKNIFIGNDCLLSYQNSFRTSDPHLIYDIGTKKRINYAKSIYIGDHVWIGQQCLILKGTKIHSGSIIGGHSVISGRDIPSNVSCGGNPVKRIKDNVFFTSESAHDFTCDDIENTSNFNSDDYIYEVDDTTVSFDKIEESLNELNRASDKLNYIREHIVSNYCKNRFAKK